MTRYLIYTRVSPRGSDWQGETSCEAQADECRRYLKAKGDGKIVDTVRDEFISGTTNDRPALQKLLNDCRRGTAKWDVLVVHDIDRLVKSQRGWYKILDTLKAAGKSIIAVRQNIDYSTPYGSFNMDNIIRMAQLMIEVGAENTRRKLKWMARQGLWAPGRVPLGYKRRAPRDNVLQVDPETAPLVLDIFACYAGGLNVIEIQRKHKRPRNTILRVLHNPVYIGRIRYADIETPGRHEPIIDMETWQRVQDRLPKTKSGPRHNKSTRENLLTGLIFCECGRAMSPATARGKMGKRYWHYRCPDTVKCPHRAYVPAEKLEEAVKEQILTLVDQPAMIRAVKRQIARSGDAVRKAVTPTIDATALRIAETRGEIKNLVATLKQGRLTADNAEFINTELTALRRRLEDLTEQRDKAKRQIEKAAEYARQSQNVAGTWATIARMLLTAGKDPHAERSIINAHIRRIDRQGQDFRITYILKRNGKGSTNCTIRHPEGVLVELMLRVA